MAKSILIVEDDEDIAKNLKLLLTDEGYAVTHATNGQLAMDYLQLADTLPGLILLDLMMPVMDGFQFRVEQKRDPKLGLIPVVIMTADGHIEAKRQKTQAHAFVRKPVDIDNFLEIVRQHCS